MVNVCISRCEHMQYMQEGGVGGNYGLRESQYNNELL